MQGKKKMQLLFILGLNLFIKLHVAGDHNPRTLYKMESF